MPVTKQLLKPQIKALLEEAKTKDADQGTDFFADKLSEVIISAIKNADVQPGIPIAGTSPSGPVTGATTSTGKLL